MTIEHGNHNKVWREQQNGRLFITKAYTERERFSCEIANIQRFAAAGFTVPRIRDIDSELLVIRFEGIEGEVKETLSLHELERCVDMLIAVMNMDRPGNSRGVAQHYCETVRKNVLHFTQTMGRSVVEPCLMSFLEEMEAGFVPSLFKDAKPTNWVMQADAVCLIDFDYVVPSFFLADLAQLLKIQYLDDPFIADALLERFLMGTLREAPFHDLVPYTKIFPLAMANASIASMRYNRHQSETTRHRLIKGAVFHLQRMEILG